MDVLDYKLDKEWAMNEPRIRNVYRQIGKRNINRGLGKVGTFTEYEGNEYKKAIDHKFQSFESQLEETLGHVKIITSRIDSGFVIGQLPDTPMPLITEDAKCEAFPT